MKYLLVVIIAVIVIIGIIYFGDKTGLMVFTTGDKTQYSEITSGPFTLKDDKFRIDENVFLIADEIRPNEQGDILFVTPNGKVYAVLPIDGQKKSSFNKHFTPDLSRSANICTVDELIGIWTIKFQGLEYESLKFEIINEFVQGSEKFYEPVC